MKDWWEVRQCLQVVALENLDCLLSNWSRDELRSVCEISLLQ